MTIRHRWLPAVLLVVLAPVVVLAPAPAEAAGTITGVTASPAPGIKWEKVTFTVAGWAASGPGPVQKTAELTVTSAGRVAPRPGR